MGWIVARLHVYVCATGVFACARVAAAKGKWLKGNEKGGG